MDSTARTTGLSESGVPRPRAASAVAFDADWQRALASVEKELAIDAASPPDLVMMFASSTWSDHYDQLVDMVWERTGTSHLLGSSARGVIANGDAHETEPGLSLMALWLPGATLTAVRLHADMLATISDPEVWPELVDLSPCQVNGFLIFAEPFRMDTQDALVRLRQVYPGTPMVGAMSSTLSKDRRGWVFFDNTVLSEGGIALAIGGPYALDVVVGQGVEPIGETWTITGAEGNRITSISCRPATDVMRETIEQMPPQFDAERGIMLGFPMSEYQDRFDPGDFVIRGIIGVDDEHGSLTVGSLPRQGQTVQFHVRDPESATTAFRAMLDQQRDSLGDAGAVASLLCTCRGRGTRMFGVEDQDAREVEAALPDIPSIGMYSAGEIAPVCGVPALNTLVAALGVLRYTGDE